MDEMTISLADLFAVLARRGRKIIVFSVIFAVLMGGFKFFLEQSKQKNPDYVAWDMVEYEEELASLERSLENTQRRLAQQQEYVDKSLWMKIDPHNKYEALYYFNISNVDEKSLEMTFGAEETPLDYMKQKIIAQYQLLWSALDLEKELNVSEYRGSESKYLRELISLSNPESGILRISVIGNSQAEVEQVANSAYQLLVNMHDKVKEGVCEHTLERFNQVVQCVIDNDMANEQTARYQEIETNEAAILDIEQSMLDLEEPDSMSVATIKAAVFWGLIGAVLCCVWYCCRVLVQGLLQSSARGEQMWKISCVGSLVSNKGIFPPVANKISGERVWEEEEQALRYICKMVEMRAGGKQILLATTLRQKKYSDQMEKVQSALANDGIKTVIVRDGMRNEELFTALCSCDRVLLMEALEQSEVAQVNRLLELVREQEKPVIGFIAV